MVLLDAQTSGGLLMCVSSDSVDAVLRDLDAAGFPRSTCVGEVIPPGPTQVEVA